MLSTVNSSVFTSSDSIKLIPVVSAEWNHNLFNPPYITTAGTGTKISGTLTSGTVASVTTGAKENFTTKIKYWEVDLIGYCIDIFRKKT